MENWGNLSRRTDFQTDARRVSRSWIDENEGEKYNYMNLDLRRTENKANSKR